MATNKNIYPQKKKPSKQLSTPCKAQINVIFMKCLFSIEYGMISQLTGAMAQIRICNISAKPPK